MTGYGYIKCLLGIEKQYYGIYYTYQVVQNMAQLLLSHKF